MLGREPDAINAQIGTITNDERRTRGEPQCDLVRTKMVKPMPPAWLRRVMEFLFSRSGSIHRSVNSSGLGLEIKLRRTLFA